MNTELMKVHTPVMTSTPTINKHYMLAKNTAFAFNNAKKRLQKLSESKERIYNSMSEQQRQIKGKAFIYLFIAGVLAVIEGYLCKNSVASVTGLPEAISILAGACFCILGICIGAYMKSGVTTNALTGRKVYTSKFWIGLFLGGLYCGFQYFLVSKSGGLEASPEIQATITNMAIITVTVCVIELVVGFCFMSGVRSTLTIWFKDQLAKIALREKNASARRTDENWVHYEYTCQASNAPVAQQTALVQEARNYYNAGYTEQETHKI